MTKLTRDEAGLDDLDFDDIEWRDAVHFRRIIRAREAADTAERELLEAVRASITAGDPWDAVAVALGTSTEKAKKRFADKI